eukprot:m.111836 g.111836  ORF g.111836 m.111836 type:complete len:158 (-) comp14074_c1_seq2:63-536(-)
MGDARRGTVERSAQLKAKMEARRKAREESGELARQKAEEEAAQKKKEQLKQMAAALGGELDTLLKEEKDKQVVQEKLAKGESAIDTSYKLFQTLYQYKSDDPDDLEFEANEILRVFDWEDDWYEGENQEGKKGCFPKTFVREIKTPGGAKSVEGMPT